MAATKKDAAFAKGDRVGWSHLWSVHQPPGSLLWLSSFTAMAPDGKLGVVKGVANDEGTYFDVLIDGEKETRTLTADELVKVVEDA